MAKLITVFFLAFLCTAAAHAQNLIIEYEMPRGYRPASLVTDRDSGRPLLSPVTFDLNGDGSPEVVMIRDDDQGTPQDLVVVDVSTSPPEVLWTVDLSWVELKTRPFYGFFAIFEVEHPRAAVFGGEGVLILRPDSGSEVVFSLDADHRLLGVVDIDGDDLVELIIDNKVGGVFEVWGAGQTGRLGR